MPFVESEEIVYPSPDPEHVPTVRVIVRGVANELVATTAYFDRRKDDNGPYRVRVRSAVQLRNIETGEMTRLLDGGYSVRRIKAYRKFSSVARNLGVSKSVLLKAVARGTTMVFVPPNG